MMIADEWASDKISTIGFRVKNSEESSDADKRILNSSDVNTTKSIEGYYFVPAYGSFPAFNYLRVIKSSSLALDESVQQYVYILRRPDKIHEDEPAPFYVGKGLKRRFAFHYYEAATTAPYGANANRYKVNTIRKAGRDDVLIQLIPCHSEEYASELEIKLIAHWGRADCNQGILTNLTDGGEGVSGLAMPEHVLKILSERARQPIKFNGEIFEGIKEAFKAHSPADIAKAFHVDIDSGYCTDYATFKGWYHYWSKQGFFPKGFNYIEDNSPVFVETSREEIQEQFRLNRIEGYKKAWNTKYPYARFLVNGNAYRTLAEAAEREDVGSESNLAALFRRMVSKDHFSTGYNLLDKDGNKLYIEKKIGLLEQARIKAAEFLRATVSEPVLINGIFYATSLEGYNASDFQKEIEYASFRSRIRRYIDAGVFPEGLNQPDENGRPIYPEIDPFLLNSGPLKNYYKVSNRLFPSMQSASLFFGLNHGAVHAYFQKWKKEAEDINNPLPFPRGFNIYESKTQKPCFPERLIVDTRVPASGYLYEGKVFAHLKDVDNYRGSKVGASAKLYRERRETHFDKGAPFDPLLNVLGWDGVPLYPVDLNKKISRSIARVNGVGSRLHNVAKSVSILENGIWNNFDSMSAAWRSLMFLQKQYRNVDSFISSIGARKKSGTLPHWIKF